MKNTQKGFAHIAAIVIILIVVGVGYGIYVHNKSTKVCCQITSEIAEKWGGEYSAEEVAADQNSNRIYALMIGSTNGVPFVELDIDEIEKQTKIDASAVAKEDGSLDIIFNKYLNDSLGSFKQGDLLINLKPEPQSDGLKVYRTTWYTLPTLNSNAEYLYFRQLSDKVTSAKDTFDFNTFIAGKVYIFADGIQATTGKFGTDGTMTAIHTLDYGGPNDTRANHFTAHWKVRGNTLILDKSFYGPRVIRLKHTTVGNRDLVRAWNDEEYNNQVIADSYETLSLVVPDALSYKSWKPNKFSESNSVKGENKYTNNKLGFSFHYPSNFTTTEYQNNPNNFSVVASNNVDSPTRFSISRWANFNDFMSSDVAKTIKNMYPTIDATSYSTLTYSLTSIAKAKDVTVDGIKAYRWSPNELSDIIILQKSNGSVYAIEKSGGMLEDTLKSLLFNNK